MYNIVAPAIADVDRPFDDLVDRIEKLNSGLAGFWGSAEGWAPESAAELMSKSRLDRQVSLSGTLRHWSVEPAGSISDGDLILAWANLGSLIEGTLKLFLSVYYEDYKQDLENLKKTQAWHAEKEKLFDPDVLRLDVLIRYCEVANLLDAVDLALCKLVQTRRNAIHAYKDRPLGTGSEFHSAIAGYLALLRAISARLPYPDSDYEPREI